ncbi:hypothetical protein [Vibrio cyclitrophicus]|uniref:hypothetical protein n=1 Tax=Vibrio cyclitrophicus TaxID=47951 RepID=UPI0011B5693B|nr:hypothetical protein [Vibrio cyclitrophicus]
MSLTVSVSGVASESVHERVGDQKLQSVSRVVEVHGDKVIGGYERVNKDGTVEQTIYAVSVLMVEGDAAESDQDQDWSK